MFGTVKPITDVTPDKDKPKRPGRHARLPKAKRPFRMVWPKIVLPPDIDLMKLENWNGGYCGCGQRKIDGALCLRCLNIEDYEF